MRIRALVTVALILTVATWAAASALAFEWITNHTLGDGAKKTAQQ